MRFSWIGKERNDSESVGPNSKAGMSFTLPCWVIDWYGVGEE